MRVAATLGYGPSPEGEAWDKMHAFLAEKGLDRHDRRFFGFNNPDPSPGSPNYGYEQWVVVGPEIGGTADATIKDVPGGLYAVTACERLAVIGQVWKALATWVDDSPHECGNQQWLEELLTLDAVKEDDYAFDLYYPLAE